MNEYQAIFDADCPNWSEDPEIVRLFLKTYQNYWDDVLRIRGHVFLNEVYYSLGLDHTAVGAVVGWVGLGDESIEFDIKEFGGVYQIDFNVDGFILDKLPKRIKRV